MAVPIKFVGDFSDVRAQFDRLVSDARNGVPLGFGSFGGGGGPGGFSAAPSIAGTLGPGGSGGNRFGGLSTQGLARYAGLGFIAREALRFGQTIGELNDQTALAGGNQAGIYKAELGFQKSISSFPVVGQAAGLLSDAIATPLGFGRAGSEATIAESEAQDAGASARRSASAGRVSLAERQSVASVTDPYEKRIQQLDVAHDRELRQITERQRAQEKADNEVLEKRKAKLAADHGGFVNGLLPGYENQQAADNAEVGNLRDQQAEARRGFEQDRNREDAIHGLDVGEVRRSQAYSRNISDASRAGSVREYALEAQGNSIAARREGLVNQNNLDLLESAARRDEWSVGKNIYDTGQAKLAALDAADARAVRLGLIGARTDLDVTNAQIEGDPLQAKLKAIQGRTKLELESPLAIFSKDYAQLVRSGGQQAENLAIKEDAESRNLRDTALRNRGAELNVLLRDDRYAGIASESLAIKDAAFLRVQQLGINNAGGRNNGAINQILNNAQAEQQLLVKQLVQSFSPQSVSPNRTDLSGGGHGGDVQKTLNDIAKNTADTAKGLANVGKAL